MPRIITVTSGKGGAGKTNMCTNVALQLSDMGKRCCVFDADLGLANINVVLGLYPERTLEDVIAGNAPLEDIVINYQGIDVIPGSSGVERIANCSPDQLGPVIEAFQRLEHYDYLFVDTAAGISKHVVSLCLAATDVLVVITPEPTSLTDAYALLKVLCLNGYEGPAQVVINQCTTPAIARQTYARFKQVVTKYLDLDLQPVGMLLSDTQVPEAVKSQVPFLRHAPQSTAAKCVRAVAANLDQNAPEDFTGLALAPFWRRVIDTFSRNLDLGQAGALPLSPPVRDAANPPPAPEPAVPAPAGSDAVLQQVAAAAERIADELRQLRLTLQNQGRISTVGSAAAPDDSVVLDFEQYKQGISP